MLFGNRSGIRYRDPRAGRMARTSSFSVYGTPEGSGRESPGRKPWDQGPVGRKPCKGDTETQRRPYRADSDCWHPTQGSHQGSHPGLSLLSPFRARRGAANNFEPMCPNSRSARKYQHAFALYWKLPEPSHRTGFLNDIAAMKPKNLRCGRRMARTRIAVM